MKTGVNGLELIKSFEGFRSRPYMPTPEDVPTIGYGTTVYPNGKRVTMKDSDISTAKATEYLANDVRECEAAISTNIKVSLTQNQIDALVSFIYNVGPTAFRKSTLARMLNAGDYKGAADQLLRWNKQGLKTLAGLTRRREAERKLFLKVG